MKELKKIRKGSYKKIKKNRKIKIVFTFSTIITIIMLTFLIKWCYENKHNESISEKIKDDTPIVESDGKNTQLVNPPDKNFPNDYWDFIKIPLISVDFSKLLNQNKNTVGWINVNNTNINYPVVQTTNNEDYLHTAFDGSKNEAGWVFADYRNDMKNFDKNTIIYGHSRLNKTMFGSLFQVLNENWYKNKYNQVIRFSTPTENTMWQIFSVYKIDTESYYLQTNFKNDTDYITFLNTIKKRSKYNFNVALDSSSKIITLSTCSDAAGTGRIVLHATLIKKEKR